MADEPTDNGEDRRLALRAGLAVIGALSFSLFFGLVVLPVAQAPNANLSAWEAICRAVGIHHGTPAQPQPPVTATANRVSQVRLTPETLSLLASANVRPGAALAAAVCAGCHGERGVSTSEDFPQLAGQSAIAIYKQLSDYRSGARVNPLMTPVAKQLTETQLAELAAYFASYQERNALGGRDELPDEQIARLTRRGDPARQIPPCEACHAPGAGGPPEAPILTGQRAEYLARQLQLFKVDSRRNDIYRRMRDIAARLSPDEMKRVAAFYEGTL
jgi:cytochrome c553